jgi:hypothetical protein
MTAPYSCMCCGKSIYHPLTAAHPEYLACVACAWMIEDMAGCKYSKEHYASFAITFDGASFHGTQWADARNKVKEMGYCPQCGEAHP